MPTVDFPQLDFYAARRYSYTPSLASTATASVCSDASSQFSQYSDNSTTTSFSDISSYSHSLPDGSIPSCGQNLVKQQAQPVSLDARRSLRQNPRRTSSSATTRSGCPPPLVRQAERKLNFVDNLVGKPR